MSATRRYFFKENLASDSDCDDGLIDHPVDTLDQANLIGSVTHTGTHLPVLDIDYEARLIPSSTSGHYHLYLDGLELSWDRYERLLLALADAGVIEKGYANASLTRKMTAVRKPGVTKEAKAGAVTP